jgi:6-phosphogluconolactonase (cycloisomerase 2 family)
MQTQSRLNFCCLFLALYCVTAIVGCGGSAGSGGTVTPPPIYPSGPVSGTEFLYQLSNAPYGAQTSTVAVSSFDPATGAVGPAVDVTGPFNTLLSTDIVPAPMVPPSAKYIYAFGAPNGEPAGIYASSITGPEGQLSPIAEPYFPSTPFVDVQSAEMDAQGRYIYVSDANGSYTPGPPTSSIRSFAISSENGTLTEGPEVTQLYSAGNLEVAAADAAGKYIYAWSLMTTGSSLAAYAIDGSSGSLTQVPGSPYLVFANPSFASNSPIAGADPNGVAVAPSGKFVYAGLILLPDNSQDFREVFVFSVDAGTGALTPLSGSPFVLEDIADIGQMVLSPNGRVLYVSGQNSAEVAGIAAYSVDPISGEISSSVGFTPQLNCCRALMMDPAGTHLVAFEYGVGPLESVRGNTDTFNVDQTTGALGGEQTATGGAGLSGVIIKIP